MVGNRFLNSFTNGVIIQWLCVQQTANKLRTSFPIAFSAIYCLTHCVQVPASFNKHITCLHMGSLSNTGITSYAMGEIPIVYFIALGI